MIRPGTDIGIKRQFFPWRILLFLCGAIVLQVFPALAGPYSQSAHGDSAAGVSRAVDGLSTPGPYVTGNCAHCHEQHASIGGLEPQPRNGGPSEFALFSPAFNQAVTVKPYQQSDLFCFYCHTGSASYQAPVGTLMNYDYANTFGGYTGGPSSIFEAFNQPLAGSDASYHNLYDIWRYAQKFSGFSSESSPCDACHNPHRARRNKAYPQDPAYTAISRPTEHESLWGDVSGEWMTNYGGRYQPPYFYGSKFTYEPGGTGEALADGSRVPDYNVFCLDCHREKIYSTTLSRDILAIDWKTGGGDLLAAGDKHGENSYTVGTLLQKPYADVVTPSGGYVLSCLDCHEAHGSSNAYLVRRSANGVALGDTFTQSKAGKSWALLCRRCHQDDYQIGGMTDSKQANRWKSVHHGGGTSNDVPYKVSGQICENCHEWNTGPEPIGCGYCHGHGTSCDLTHPGTLPNGKTIPAPYDGVRRTF